MLVLQFVILGTLLLFSAFFSGTETALFSLSAARLEALGRSADHADRRVARLMAEPSSILVTILFGNMLVNVGASSLATDISLTLFGPQWLELAGLAMLLVLLMLGEVTPKSLAAYRPLARSRRASGPLDLFHRLFLPVRLPLTALSRSLVHSLEGRVPQNEAPTADELRTALEMAGQEGELDEGEETIMVRLFELDSKRVRRLMTPAADVVSVSVNATPAEALAVFRRYQFARLPCHEGDPDNWVGVVRAQDVGHAVLAGPPEDLRPLLREVHFVPEEATALTLLAHFHRTRTHLALVSDEYGVFVGLATLQDIYDELEESPRHNPRLRRQGPERFVCAGSLPLDDFNRATGSNVTDENYSSLGGWLTGLEGRIPRTGEWLVGGGFQFTILEAEPTRIVRVMARRLPEEGQ
jgi:putative hemolysin